MFDNKKSLRAFIVMTVLMLALIINGLFTLGSTKNNPATSWQSQPVGNGTEYNNDYVVLEVLNKDSEGNDISTSDGESGTLIYAWINVGRIQKSFTKEGYGVINLRSNSSDSWDGSYLASSVTTVEIKKGVDTSEGEYQYGWYRVSLTSYKKYWQISTKDGLEINEVVFTNKDGTVLPATLKGANEWKTLSSGVVAENYLNVDKLSENSKAHNVCDEQDMFQKYSKMSKKYNFTKEEAGVVNTALSFLNVDGQYLDKTSGAFGLELITLGIAVFGVNTLGLRIVPYIFFMLTVLLLFVLGRKLFNNIDYGVIFASVYALFGLGFSVGSLGSVNAITVFFTVLSVFFMLNFYSCVSKYLFRKNKHTFKTGKTNILIHVFLSGMAFAFAVTCSLTAVFALPAIIAIFVLGILKAKKVYAYNAKLAEFEDEKILNDGQYKTNVYGSLAIFATAFIVLPILLTLLFYGIAGTTYTQFYNASNLIQAIIANNNGVIFSGFNGEFIKWVVGAGSTVVYTGAENGNVFSSVYVAMNVVAQLITLASFVFVTVKVVIANFFKKDGSAKDMNTPYIVLALGYIVSWLLFAFVKDANVSDYLLASTFAIGFVPFAYDIIKNNDRALFSVKGKEVSVSSFVLTLAIALIVLFFGLGYVMFAGIEVPTVAAKILFNWWLF